MEYKASGQGALGGSGRSGTNKPFSRGALIERHMNWGFGLTEHDHAPSGAEHDLLLVVLPGRIVLSFCLGAADRFQPERLRSGGVRHLY